MNSKGSSISGPNHPLRLLNSASYPRLTHAPPLSTVEPRAEDTRSEIWGFSKLGDIVAAVWTSELLTSEVPQKLTRVVAGIGWGGGGETPLMNILKGLNNSIIL